MFCRACLRAAGAASSSTRTLARRHASTSARPLKLAIVGAGPSGFYAASRILSSIPPDSPNGQHVQVDMFERLPTPYGLVRYGVAPDHPEVKNCQHKFDELGSDPRFSFYGNVSIGSQPSSSPDEKTPASALSSYTYPHALHLPFESLLAHYSTVLLTYGASLSNPLASVAGSSSSSAPLQGVYPALALVGWYNGHPAFSHLRPDLANIRTVSVIGHGNVALDVSRILLKDVKDLAHTDIPDEVMHVLAESKVDSVTATGRRGPGQVAFTTKEFREMLNLSGVRFDGLQGDLVEQARGMVDGDRMKKRLLGLMEKSSSAAAGDGGLSKEFKLDFLRSPSAFRGTKEGKVEQVEWTVNELLTSSASSTSPTPPRSQADSVPRASVVARPTEQTVVTPAELVVESVGYRSEPLGIGETWILPFDSKRGRVQNAGGRIVDEAGSAVRVVVMEESSKVDIQVPGLYAAGWAARGPVGVIASTMHDAYALADTILQDHYAESASPKAVEAGLPGALARGVRERQVVELDGWRKIDEAERQRAKDCGSGKEREKFTRVEDMLAVLS